MTTEGTFSRMPNMPSNRPIHSDAEETQANIESHEYGLGDVRGWWFSGAASCVAIAFIVYCWFDDFSFYSGWSFWWRVIMFSCIFIGGFLFYAYCDGGKKSDIPTGKYLENVEARIKIFWVVCLLALLCFASMPGKLVRSNISLPHSDPGEWSRP